MNRRMAATLLGTALKTGFGLAVLVALIDSFKGWMITGLSPWGSESLLLILLAGWMAVFLPASLISWLLALALSRYPRAWSRLKNHTNAVFSGVTCGLAFFSVAGLATFRIWLPDNIHFLSVTGAGIIILIGILAVLAGVLSGGIIRWIETKYSRTYRLCYWGFSGIVLFLAITFSLQTGDAALRISSSRKTADTTRPNIFIILIDTLRADALGCYGKSGTETPAIDRLAADGVLYRNAYTTAPWTRPAMASLWTGLFPSTHQVRRGNKMAEGADRLTRNAITLAEYLKESGYQTCGLNTNPVIMPQFGLHQGFDLYYTFPYPAVGHSMLIQVIGAALTRYYTPNHYADGEVLTGTLIKCLQKPPDEPFLMYAHYMDPHEGG